MATRQAQLALGTLATWVLPTLMTRGPLHVLPVTVALSDAEIERPSGVVPTQSMTPGARPSQLTFAPDTPPCVASVSVTSLAVLLRTTLVLNPEPPPPQPTATAPANRTRTPQRTDRMQR